MSNEQLIERLLYSSEGDALDFKLRQYKFASATDEEKSELLKDILAFANSWRDSPAHIVIGIRDGTKEVEGMDADIDEASVQQFVDAKTNKPVRFSYEAMDHKGKKLGLFTIPVQERPFYVSKQYGKLKANTVYVRRGSSTAEADPDEIAKMGHSTSNARERVAATGKAEMVRSIHMLAGVMLGDSTWPKNLKRPASPQEMLTMERFEALGDLNLNGASPFADGTFAVIKWYQIIEQGVQEGATMMTTTLQIFATYLSADIMDSATRLLNCRFLRHHLFHLHDLVHANTHHDKERVVPMFMFRPEEKNMDERGYKEFWELFIQLETLCKDI